MKAAAKSLEKQVFCKHFTLIELFIVITVIAIPASLIPPGLKEEVPAPQIRIPYFTAAGADSAAAPRINQEYFPVDQFKQ